MTDVTNLAKAFSRHLIATLTTAQMRHVVILNRAEPVNSGVCHSHDYCDANMVMLAAFEETFGREPGFLDNSEDSTDINVWNAAWTLAVLREFIP